MNWNIFILALTLLYAAYYAGLVLLELYGRPKAGEEEATTYVVRGLREEEAGQAEEKEGGAPDL